MEFYGFVYKITNQQNNKVYIGIQTTNRMDYLGGGVLIIKARQKYGKRFFVKEILGYCKNKKELCDAEKMCIDFFDSTNRLYGYNLSIGGESGSKGVIWNEEQKQKMSILKMGHSTSQTTKEKISLKNKGRKHTDDAKLKMRKPKLSLKKLTPEQIETRRKNKSEIVTRYWSSPEGLARRCRNNQRGEI